MFLSKKYPLLFKSSTPTCFEKSLLNTRLKITRHFGSYENRLFAKLINNTVEVKFHIHNHKKFNSTCAHLLQVTIGDELAF